MSVPYVGSMPDYVDDIPLIPRAELKRHLLDQLDVSQLHDAVYDCDDQDDVAPPPHPIRAERPPITNRED